MAEQINNTNQTSTSNTMGNVSQGVGILEKLVELIKKHGFFGILQSIFIFVIFGYGIFFVTNPTYVFEQYDKYKEAEHEEQILQTFKSTTEINDMLKTYMYTEESVDRIFYIEFHNSIKGLDKMPYIYGSFRHEFVKNGRSYISDEFRDDFMLSKYLIFDYIYENKQFCGSIEDLKAIDERSAVMLSRANIEHFEMILIESDGVPVGVLGVTTNKHLDNMYDLTRIGYTLISKKVQ